MRMCTVVRRPSLLAIVGMSAIAVALSGCPSANEPTKPAESPGKKQSAIEFPAEEPIGRPKAEEAAAHRPSTTKKAPSPAQQVAQDVEEAATKPRDLGPPLVDDPSSLLPHGPAGSDLDRQEEQMGGSARRGLFGRLPVGILRLVFRRRLTSRCWR